MAPSAWHSSQHSRSRWRRRLHDFVDADGSIFRDEFLREVWREKRRSERSGSPVSLATFRVSDTNRDVWLAVDRVVEGLSLLKRETDLLCRVDARTIAALLPDTSSAGLDAFVAKVRDAMTAAIVEVDTATYPGQSLDRLIGDRILPTDGDDDAAGQREPTYALKRVVDVVGALFALVVLSPLMLLTAIAIRLTSPGPVIFKQKRLGKGGVPFTILKFRSMRCDADDKIHRDYVAALIRGESEGERGEDGGVSFKMVADPRVTTVGRFIRKTSIDELPQFFNVLKGEMSLVGPRPPTPYEVDNYEPWHLRRVFELKPGLTGIWQVEGRSRVTFDEMVRMDLRYLRRCSLMFDVQILLRTVLVVLRCDGAE